MKGKDAAKKVFSEVLTDVDVLVIGGGPAGLAAACAARDNGAERVLILERDSRLGGILNQCIHNGFGLHAFKEELTGPEYARRYIDMAKERGIPAWLNTTVLDIGGGAVTAVSANRGLIKITPKSTVLTCGCRERPRGALNIPGSRPAGIYSAGTAQKYVNTMGYLPGRRVVVLGSGDIGLIMARRMTFEGAEVLAVAELMPHSSGLNRNIVQCLDDFGIPLLLSHTVTEIKGRDRLESVTVSRVDENLKPIPGSERVFECDTLLLSVGLLPENELSKTAGIALSPVTGGPVVDARMMTGAEGIFAAGNMLHVHDLVDYVSEESAVAGKYAALYARGVAERGGVTRMIETESGRGVRYIVPQKLDISSNLTGLDLKFRVDKVYRNASLKITAGTQTILERKKSYMAPGEMETFRLGETHAAAVSAGGALKIEVVS